MFYTILKEFTDQGNQPLRLLIAPNNFGQSDYLVIQRPSFSRTGDPTWDDVLTLPAPSVSIDQISLTANLIQLLKSIGLEFPGHNQNLVTKEA